MKQFVYVLDSEYEMGDNWEDFLRRLRFEENSFKDLKSLMKGQNTSTRNSFFRWLLSSNSTREIYLEVLASDDSVFKLGFGRTGNQPRVTLYIDEDANISNEADRYAKFWNSFKCGFSEGILFIDKNNCIDEISDRTPQMFPLLDTNGVQLNRQVMLGKPFRRFFPELWVTHLREFILECALNHLSSFCHQYKFENKYIECKAYPIFENAKLEGLMVLYFDVTERVKLEKKLVETNEVISGKSHLIALGELAGKIAHEINTPLGAITLNASLGEKKCSSFSPEKNQELFKKIKDTGFFIGEVVKNLLQFSRQEVGTKFQECSLKEAVNDVVSIARVGTQNSGIALEIDIDDSCVCEIKKVQLQQVFLNLFSNSVAALKNKDDENKWILIVGRVEGDFVKIQFIDSGSGIQNELAEKILTPNFSTKELGKNLGIGLSVSSGIIQTHGGTFRLDQSHPNTCFEIKIPMEQTKNMMA